MIRRTGVYMNWKDHAYLFANGKFKVKYSRYEQIIGITNCANRFLTPASSVDINKCALIARKIEDLSDEEIKWFVVQWHGKSNKAYIDDMRQHLRRWADDSDLESYQLIELLRIGVYPFPQNHFGETVIDINTLP